MYVLVLSSQKPQISDPTIPAMTIVKPILPAFTSSPWGKQSLTFRVYTPHETPSNLCDWQLSWFKILGSEQFKAQTTIISVRVVSLASLISVKIISKIKTMQCVSMVDAQQERCQWKRTQRTDHDKLKKYISWKE